ncbi:MAG: transaldolase family protein [SAR324 cluster bacterium]
MLTPADIHQALGERRALMEKINPTPAGKALAHPAEFAPRIFADTASLDEIRPLREGGIVNGVTTNPSLVKRAGATSWAQAEKIMKDIVDYMKPAPVSLELTELEPEKMVQQARHLGSFGDNVVIKVPTGGFRVMDKDPFTGLKMMRRLWGLNIKVNATLVFNTAQALWAANAGAIYVSPFMGRLADYLYRNDQVERGPGNSLYYIEDHKVPAGGPDRAANTAYVATGGERKDAGVRLINEITAVFATYRIRTEVLAASFRNAAQVMECLLAGADILTVPAPILMGVADHPLSDEGMKAFVADSKVFDK